MIHTGDCVEVMAMLAESSVDAIVTDPPYDLVSVTKRFGAAGARNTPAMETEEGSVWARKARGFMGKTWDGTGVAFRPETWLQALRIAKPGAHLLAFGGTRTYHRLACAIEDAGWEIRDCLVWAYASGFPKSLNFPDGFGTALKPAWEPIVLARKPLIGTVAANRERHGTGALNIDASRIPFRDAADAADAADGWDESVARGTGADPSSIAFIARPDTYTGQSGRWPANVLLTDGVFDGGIQGVVGGGETKSGLVLAGSEIAHDPDDRRTYGDFGGMVRTAPTYGDSGTYSRFFLIPRGSRSGVPSGNMGTCQTCGVPIAEQASTARTPRPDTALPSAAMPPSELPGQLAFDAVGQSPSPETATAPSPVATPLDGTLASMATAADQVIGSDTSAIDRSTLPAGPLDTASPSVQPARTAEQPPTSTDTTTTTAVPSLCGRCADDAIAGRTLRQPKLTRPAPPVDGDEYARFYLVAKADRTDREPVLPQGVAGVAGVAGVGALRDGGRLSVPRANSHPTVKPTDLMRHLVRLVTPPGGTVLDPFLGSGTTGIAAEMEGFAWIGIEREPEYVAIAEARLNGTQRGLGLVG